MDIFIELNGIDATGLPRNVLYKLENLHADEIRTTIYTAAVFLTLDADDSSVVVSEITGLKTQIEADGGKIKRSWLDRLAELTERLSAAEAWRDCETSAVLIVGHNREVVWRGNLGAVAVAAREAVQAVSLKPSATAAKRISEYPVPAPAPVPEEPPQDTTEVTLADLPAPDASIETQEQKIQRLLAEGLSLAEARKKARLKQTAARQ